MAESTPLDFRFHSVGGDAHGFDGSNRFKAVQVPGFDFGSSQLDRSIRRESRRLGVRAATEVVTGAAEDATLRGSRLSILLCLRVEELGERCDLER